MSEDKIAQLVRVAELRRQSAEIDYAAAVSAVRCVKEEIQCLEQSHAVDAEYSDWVLTSLRHGRDEFINKEIKRLTEKLSASQQLELIAQEKLKAAIVSEAQIKDESEY